MEGREKKRRGEEGRGERRGEEQRKEGEEGEERSGERRIFKVEGSPQEGSCSSWHEQPEKHQSSETSPC